MATRAQLAQTRRLWQLLEALHGVVYFAPEPLDALVATGLRGFWMSYFAGRAAPMGAVTPAVVEATFHNFAPRLVHRAIPDAWRFADPATILAQRGPAAAAALRRLLGSDGDPTAVARAVELLDAALVDLDCSGRPLAAANADLARTGDEAEPLVRLWQLATVVREHRGDGHVALLVAAGLDGCQAHVTLVAGGGISRSALQPARGWEDDEWDAAEQALVERGWLDGSGRPTAVGRRARRQLETETDRLASAPWRRLGEAQTSELEAILTPWASAIWASGTLPAPLRRPLDPPARQPG
jgi:hypothetical protein